ncbi:MAG: Uma2 family endonuclease [Chloroflexota bacterium]
MLVKTALMTAAELEQMSGEEARSELVKGELVKMTPAGHEHGELAGNIFYHLLTINDSLTDNAVLPGFSLPVKELFQ